MSKLTNPTNVEPATIIRIEHPVKFLDDFKKGKSWDISSIETTGWTFSCTTNNPEMIDRVQSEFQGIDGSIIFLDEQEINKNIQEWTNDYKLSQILNPALPISIFKTLICFTDKYFHNSLEIKTNGEPNLWYGLWSTKKHHVADIEYFFDKLRQEWKTKTKTPKKNSRTPLPKGIRFEVFKKDNHKCVVCGRGVADNITLHVDHIIPIAKGGTDELSNLRTLCDECNLNKSDLLQEKK